jgi:hypothetical protein
MYIGLHVRYPLFLPILMKIKISRQVFEKYSDIKFYENPSGGSQVVPCGRTDMTKLIVAFRNIANVPKNALSVCFSSLFGCSHFQTQNT